MSPHIEIELAELRKQLALDIRYEKRQRQNERRLVSRNKREGWYWAKLPHGCGYARTRTKLHSLAWRKQTGAQVMFVKERK